MHGSGGGEDLWQVESESQSHKKKRKKKQKNTEKKEKFFLLDIKRYDLKVSESECHGRSLDDDGVLLDICTAQRLLRQIMARYDHQNLDLHEAL